MKVERSNTGMPLTGLPLIEEMAALTGLPSDFVKPQLTKLVQRSGLQLETLTLDELRPVLMQFLAEMVLDSEEPAPFALAH